MASMGKLSLKYYRPESICHVRDESSDRCSRLSPFGLTPTAPIRIYATQTLITTGIENGAPHEEL